MGLRRGQTVEELVFGTRDEAVVDAGIDDFCARRLGAGIATILLRETSVGIVRGAELEASAAARGMRVGVERRKGEWTVHPPSNSVSGPARST